MKSGSKKLVTPSYSVRFEVVVAQSDIPDVERRMECARQVYNACLGRSLKLWKGVRGNPQWRSALRDLQALNRKAKLSPEEKEWRKTLHQQMNDCERGLGLSEYSLHAFAAKVNQHFGAPLGANEFQKAATFAWRAFERFRYGLAKRVQFKRRGDPVTIENKTDRYGLRLRGQTVVWSSQCSRELKFPVIVKKGDRYAEQTFLDRTKYLRFFEREIRGKRRFFIEAVKEGTPPAKNRRYGEGGAAMGIDLSPSTLVAYSPEKAVIEALVPELEDIEPELRRINRAIDRSHRATNPGAYAENGAIKKGSRLLPSRRCLRLKSRRKDLYRKQSAARKQSHEKTANRLIALTTDIKVEDTPVQSWITRAKKTKVNRENGKICSKRRFGKAVARSAPAMLMNIIDRKLRYRGRSLQRVVSTKVKASQFDHSTGQCRKKRLSDRWCVIDGHKVQRDLYSAFLISHVTGRKLDVIDQQACCDDWMNFLKLQEEALKTCDKSLGIFR